MVTHTNWLNWMSDCIRKKSHMEDWLGRDMEICRVTSFVQCGDRTIYNPGNWAAKVKHTRNKTGQLC